MAALDSIDISNSLAKKIRLEYCDSGKPICDADEENISKLITKALLDERIKAKDRINLFLSRMEPDEEWDESDISRIIMGDKVIPKRKYISL